MLTLALGRLEWKRDKSAAQYTTLLFISFVMASPRPIQKIAKAATQCSAEVSAEIQSHPITNVTDMSQAALYGKCIVADYNAVEKDKCAREFMKLKNCYMVSYSRREEGRS